MWNVHRVVLTLLALSSVALLGAYLVTLRIWRLPRHPVVLCLLVVGIPRSVVLQLPVFSNSNLFCPTTNVLANFLFVLHSGFVLSFSIALLRVVLYPHPTPPPTALRPPRRPSTTTFRQNAHGNGHSRTPCRTRTRAVAKISYHDPSPRISLLLCIVPFFWTIPVLVVGLLTAIPSSPYYAQTYFDGWWCRSKSPLFMKISLISQATPLLIAGGVCAWLIAVVVRFYLMHWWIDVHPHPPAESPSKKCWRCEVGKTGHLTRRKVPLHLPELSFVLRFGLMILIIICSSIVLTLRLVLHDSALSVHEKIERYWKSAVPLLECLVFVTQSTILKLWFPSLYAKRCPFTGKSFARPRSASLGTRCSRSPPKIPHPHNHPSSSSYTLSDPHPHAHPHGHAQGQSSRVPFAERHLDTLIRRLRVDLSILTNINPSSENLTSESGADTTLAGQFSDEYHRDELQEDHGGSGGIGKSLRGSSDSGFYEMNTSMHTSPGIGMGVGMGMSTPRVPGRVYMQSPMRAEAYEVDIEMGMAHEGEEKEGEVEGLGEDEMLPVLPPLSPLGFSWSPTDSSHSPTHSPSHSPSYDIDVDLENSAAHMNG
ncbi:hypothetical protein SISSUDRAFT_1065551 [Sistotremastrum suecicum HHB10207 ss-3]|uniref:Uncharacterized protein n=1 Tax=Sistotremastrum suecicum HHB10207 ss-3 TaxID=1314776 RepID=A0A165ZCR3_9AGAM|nr:hypothetical protein SISSUDRAFT_1065551 [Sistotremastrum suecicum HHB10207 ss-3]